MENMSPADIQFLAGRELIWIIPNSTCGQVFLTSEEIGPLIPGLPVQVPLWVAGNLKKDQECRILLPDWMNMGALEQIKNTEIKGENFAQMPEYYMFISQLLFATSFDEIENADSLKTMIKDIWDIRTSKLMISVKNFLNSENSYTKVDNLTTMEIATVQPFFRRSREATYRITKMGKTVHFGKTYTSAVAANNTQLQSESISGLASMSNSKPNGETQ